MEKTFENTEGNFVKINKSEIDCIRGSGNGSVVYMNNGDSHFLKSSFYTVWEAFDFM